MSSLEPDVLATRAIAVLERLVAFDTTSRSSNLALIEHVEAELSALGAALTSNWVLFMLFRFLGGLGVGASSVTAPLYISEVSPPASRSRSISPPAMAIATTCPARSRC